MSSLRKQKPAATVDLEPLLSALEAEARARRLLKQTQLPKLGVPRAQARDALAALAARGLERTKAGVRVPLLEQVSALLRERGSLPLAGLQRLLAGASAPEAKQAAVSLAASGAASWVVRGKVEALVGPDEACLPRETLQPLSRALKQAAALCTKAQKGGAVPKTLLRGDLQELLLDFVAQGAAQPRAVSPLVTPPAAPPAPEGAAPVGPPLRARLLSMVREHLQAEVGLASVPAVVRALGGAVEETQRALLDAAREGLVELQPESGLGRLPEEDLRLCPPGPQGTRLSWARLIGG